MRVKVLGSAAGGGFPQWNCGCTNCNRLREGVLKGRARTQAQVGVSPAPGKWFLLNASPDLRQQIVENSEFAPAEETRSTPIIGIFLTSADVDCVMGLLHLREFQPLTIYSTAAVRRVMTEENSLFRTLERSNPPVRWEDLALGKWISVFEDSAAGAPEGLSCTAISVGGSFPDYVSDALWRTLPEEEATIGLEFAGGGKRFFYAPNLPGRGEEWKLHAKESDLAIVDGTFWTDDELLRVRGSGKTAREMGHLPLSGANGLMEQLSVEQTPAEQPQGARNARHVLIHLNNTNPALDEESAASHALREAGWEIATDGMEIDL
jgi:pyrroloquinoline quinone biosynthesis protein B